jgi:hypothetical protein
MFNTGRTFEGRIKERNSSSNLLAVLIVHPVQGHKEIRGKGRNVRMKKMMSKKKAL